MSKVQARAFTPREHTAYLADFLRAEQTLNGPDAHLVALGPLLRDQSLEERIWRCGCYAAVYNAPGAEAIWSAISYETARRNPETIPDWLECNWANLPIRKERRAVRTPKKMSACLQSYLKWQARRPEVMWSDPNGYETIWASTDEIYGMGRYVRIKLLEAFRRYTNGAFELQDIRANGGHSPRAMLALLYPRYVPELLGGDSRSNCKIAEMCAAWVKEELAERHDVHASFFEIQVALCEYKSCYGRNQYPGRTLDSELGHWYKAERIGHEAQYLEARKELFPHVALGELQGWKGRRDALHDCLKIHGYMWVDTQYDYLASRGRLADPVKR